jgi:hypothetical protein
MTGHPRCRSACLKVPGADIWQRALLIHESHIGMLDNGLSHSVQAASQKHLHVLTILMRRAVLVRPVIFSSFIVDRLSAVALGHSDQARLRVNCMSRQISSPASRHERKT